MKLLWLSINNYKSLRQIRFLPQQMSVVVGANASGKTNLADAFNFLSEVYRHGLQVAVARKGGYENMAFRRMRRSRGAITFDIGMEIEGEDMRFIPADQRWPRMLFRHRFSIETKGYSIRADFEVTEELLDVAREQNGVVESVISIVRDRDGKIDFRGAPDDQQEKLDLQTSSEKKSRWQRWMDFSDVRYFAERRRNFPPSELFLNFIGRYAPGLSIFVEAVSGIRVFQISPTRSREFGVPLPRPEMEVSGGNLPSVVDMLRREYPRQWSSILSVMRGIIPQLIDITVEYTSMRTLSLGFEEKGQGRPWGVHEVSDGTMQALALLVAIFDPRFTFLVLEEPENSVHPWIIRRLMAACEDASKDKQIVITTHSPMVINAASPHSVFVTSRSSNGTRLQRLTELDPQFLGAWSEGSVPTFEYLDSGAVPGALPPPSDDGMGADE